jgi:hypothetical protein
MQATTHQDGYTYRELITALNQAAGGRKSFSSTQIQALVRREILKRIVPPGSIQGTYDREKADAYMAELRAFYGVSEEESK